MFIGCVTGSFTSALSGARAQGTDVEMTLHDYRGRQLRLKVVHVSSVVMPPGPHYRASVFALWRKIDSVPIPLSIPRGLSPHATDGLGHRNHSGRLRRDKRLEGEGRKGSDGWPTFESFRTPDLSDELSTLS